MRAATREATEPKMALLLPLGSGCKVNMSTITKIVMITNQQSQESSEHNNYVFTSGSPFVLGSDSGSATELEPWS